MVGLAARAVAALGQWWRHHRLEQRVQRKGTSDHIKSSLDDLKREPCLPQPRVWRSGRVARQAPFAASLKVRRELAKTRHAVTAGAGMPPSLNCLGATWEAAGPRNN